MEFMCYECEREFDEPRYIWEDRGEFWGMPAFEKMAYCPYCGSEAFDYTANVIADLADVENEEDEEDDYSEDC